MAVFRLVELEQHVQTGTSTASQAAADPEEVSSLTWTSFYLSNRLEASLSFLLGVASSFRMEWISLLAMF